MKHIIGTIVLMTILGCGGGEGAEDVLHPDIGTDAADKPEMSVGPRIKVTPFIIDFGYEVKDDFGTLDVVISNEGNDTLVLHADGVQLDPASVDLKHIDIQVDGGLAKSYPAEELTIEPAECITITLQWKAVNPVGNQGDPIGHLLIASNDDETGLLKLDIFGRVDAPILTLLPEAVDFLFVGQMITAKRTLTMNNEGTGDLIINEGAGCLTIEGDDADGFPGEFGFEPTDGFPPTDLTNCGEGAIAANTGTVVTLTFTNLGPDNGTATAFLTFTSNDPSRAEVEVPLMAKRTGSPTCEPVLVPSKLYFGVVPKGYYSDLPFKLINMGSGYCQFLDVRIEDCCDTTSTCACKEPGTGVPSEMFETISLVSVPTDGLIGPGGYVMFKIPVDISGSDSIFWFWDICPALVGATVHDPHLDKMVTIPELDPNTGCWEPTIPGYSGLGDDPVAVLPGEIDFGITNIGSSSQTFKVCVYNTSTESLAIKGIELVGCSPEFKLQNLPSLPKDVPVKEAACFDTVYLPQDEGPDSCDIRVETTAASMPVVTVKLEGEGTY